MHRILKYPLTPKPEIQQVELPSGAQIVSVIEQNEQIMLYAL